MCTFFTNHAKFSKKTKFAAKTRQSTHITLDIDCVVVLAHGGTVCFVVVLHLCALSIFHEGRFDDKTEIVAGVRITRLDYPKSEQLNFSCFGIRSQFTVKSEKTNKILEMEANTRNFSELKKERFDDEGVQSTTTLDQVRSSSQLGSFRFYFHF